MHISSGVPSPLVVAAGLLVGPRNPRGSGLGLAITTEVCARCGWQLAFEPVARRGLRVTLRAPIA
jgi:signal transduction histidine kinase